MATLLRTVGTHAMFAQCGQRCPAARQSGVRTNDETGDNHPLGFAEGRNLIDVEYKSERVGRDGFYPQQSRNKHVLNDKRLRHRSKFGDVHDCLPRASYGAVQGQHTRNASLAKVGISPSYDDFEHGYSPVNGHRRAAL
jgi:hypothetical protein